MTDIKGSNVVRAEVINGKIRIPEKLLHGMMQNKKIFMVEDTNGDIFLLSRDPLDPSESVVKIEEECGKRSIEIPHEFDGCYPFLSGPEIKLIRERDYIKICPRKSRDDSYGWDI